MASSLATRGNINHSLSSASFMLAGSRVTGPSVPSDDAAKGLRASLHISGLPLHLAFHLPVVVLEVNLDCTLYKQGATPLAIDLFPLSHCVC